MRGFARVVQAGSFTRAAEALDTQKSHVSRVIAQLERELGVKLIDRTTRTQALTEFGREFHERAVGILGAVDDTLRMADLARAEPRGMLRLTCGVEFGQLAAGAWVDEYLARHPQVSVEAEYTSRVIDLVHEGFDVAIRIGEVPESRLAVFSCSNYPAGFFNAYADAAAQPDVDAAVHLGDFIYEYSRAGYASQNAAALGRPSEPDAELITLSDYRRRHAQYRSDPDLQALCAAMPVIAVWDDHESANNARREGAENHQPTEGDWTTRKATAIRVWHEWMPTRVGADPGKTWRRFDFGTPVSLHMLDTRLAGRDRQLDIASDVGAGGSFDGARFAAEVADPNRQLLGVEQTAWLQAQLQASTATRQVLGQQVLMGRMAIPAPVALQQITVGAYAALVQKAQTAPGTLTPQEQATLAAPSIPYNLDAWDGHAAARETVLGAARTLDRNLVVLAGDTHNAWGNDLLDLQGNRCGVEFATPSVSSPGFEAVFPNEDPQVFAASVEALIGPLQYADTSRSGYLLITATASECRGEWRFVSTTQSRTFTASTGRTLRVLPGAAGRALVA